MLKASLADAFVVLMVTCAFAMGIDKPDVLVTCY